MGDVLGPVQGWMIVVGVYGVGLVGILTLRRLTHLTPSWQWWAGRGSRRLELPRLLTVPRLSLPELAFLLSHVLALGLGGYLKAAYSDAGQPDAAKAADLAHKADLVHISVGSMAWRVALLLGPLSLIPLGLLFLPAARSPWVTLALGIPFERRLLIHRAAARLFLLVSSVHGVWILVLNRAVGLDRPGKNLSGAVSLLLFWLVALSSLEPLRRRFFHLFYASHFVFLPALIAGFVHAGGVAVASIAGVPWLLSALLRTYLLYLNHTPVVKARTLPGDVVELVVAAPPAPFFYRYAPAWLAPAVDAVSSIEPGQYVFLGDPSIGWELHPFSVANYVPPPSSPSAKPRVLRFLIKAAALQARPHEWCSKLHAAVSRGDALHIHLEGYYGALGVAPNRYSALALVSGGIGVTPNAALLDALLDPESDISIVGSDTVVHFVWALRSIHLFTAWFPGLLARAAAAPNVVLHLYDTVGPSGSISLFGAGPPLPHNEHTDTHVLDLTVTHGRPDLDAILGSILFRTAVYVCGPPSMVEAATRAGHTHGHHVHSEVFTF